MSVAHTLNVASFLGILVLSVPAWSMNSRKKKVTRLERAEEEERTDKRLGAKARSILKERSPSSRFNGSRYLPGRPSCP